jgi:hypothetical protein
MVTDDDAALEAETRVRTRSADAAGLYHARRRLLAYRFVDGLAQWRAGLVCEAGMMVQNHGLPFVALNSGTTAGTVGPSATAGKFTDTGGVSWLFVWPASILTAPSTPE